MAAQANRPFALFDKVATSALKAKCRPPPDDPSAEAWELDLRGSKHWVSHRQRPSRSARASGVLVLAFLLGCHDGIAPGNAGIQIVAGDAVNDTALAKLSHPLTVEVRGADGKLLPGVRVRFQSVIISPNDGRVRVLVAPPGSPLFHTAYTENTDALGRASASVQLAALAGPGKLEIVALDLGYADTALYTVFPGQRVGVHFAPDDTLVIVGSQFQSRASAVDQNGNPRPDAISYAVPDGKLDISATGVITTLSTGRVRVIVQSGSADTGWINIVPDGTIAAYRAGVLPEGIVTFVLDGSHVTWLAPAVQDLLPTSPRWDPNGNRVLFNSQGTAPRLYVVDLQGNQGRLLSPTPAGLLEESAANPALMSGRIYFTALVSGLAGSAIWRANRDGSNAVEVWRDPNGNTASKPAPSPDETKLAYVQNDDTIRLLDLISGTLSSWTPPGRVVQWSPIGDRIAYVGQNFELHVVDPDGTGDHVISPPGHTSFGWSFGWSPDGNWIVARTDSHLELIEVATGAVMVLPYGGSYYSPAWKP